MKRFSLGQFRLNSPPSIKPFFVIGLVAISTVLAPACQKRKAGDANVSEIKIGELNTEGYDRFEIEMNSKDKEEHSIPTQKLPRGTLTVDLKAFPGEYTIRLDYYLKDKLVFGADLCPDDKKNNVKTFVSGPNEVSINICKADGDAIPPAQPPAASKTFSIREGKLYKPNSQSPFFMRGVNMPTAYFFDNSLKALTRVKELGFNTVRLVWCADESAAKSNERCNLEYHKRSTADLEKVLKETKRLGLVAVFELQNITGSTDVADLERLVKYYLKPDIKKVLIDYQDIVLINIANEWHGDWSADKVPLFFQGYKSVIKTLRKGLNGEGGLPHVLIADARGYAQNGQSIIEDTEKLLKEDKEQFKENMFMMSSHMYDAFSSREKVMAVVDKVRENNWPFMVGEFACSHGDKGSVDCDTIMSEANSADKLKLNIIAWSYTGNSEDLKDLDLVNLKDWTCLTPFGKKVIKGMFGEKHLNAILAADRTKRPVACN